LRWAAPATLNTLRTMTAHHGTLDCQMADIARTPA